LYRETLYLGLPLAWRSVRLQAIAGGRYVQSQLFGLRPADPLTLSLGCLALAAVTLLAGYLPARRA
jgi:hypothetical protein